MTTSQKKPVAPKKAAKPSPADTQELETDIPMSEKDEVKKAEQRMNKGNGKSK